MRLVWSQPASSHDRPRQVLLLAVLCIFLGFLVGGRPEMPRPFRAAAASLFATGGLFFFAGVAGLALQKGRRIRSSPLSLAGPPDPVAPDSVSGFKEEEQR